MKIEVGDIITFKDLKPGWELHVAQPERFDLALAISIEDHFVDMMWLDDGFLDRASLNTMDVAIKNK